MSLFKKSDVKNHLSAMRHNSIHIAPVTKPDGTAFPETDQLPRAKNGADFAQDFTGDHKDAVSSDAPSDSLGAHARPNQ